MAVCVKIAKVILYLNHSSRLHQMRRFVILNMCIWISMNVRSFSLVLCVGALCGCTREYDCLCGHSGPEPYVYTVSAQNLDDAIVECSPLGSDCEIIQ